jgi:hypothetical protein
MLATPHGHAFDGRVEVFNFTHYNTDDLIRLLEAPRMARQRLGGLGNEEQVHKGTIDFRYAGCGKAKAKIVGPSWRHNGIRIRKMADMFENPLEALATQTAEIPLDAVQQLLAVASRLYGGYVRYGRRDVDMDTLALGLRVRVDDRSAIRMPKGYMRREYAVRKGSDASLSVAYRLQSAARSGSRGSKRLDTIRACAAGLGMDNPITPEIEYRLRLVREEAAALAQYFRGLTDRFSQEEAE